MVFDVRACVCVCYYRQPVHGVGAVLSAADKHQLHQLVASHGAWPGFAKKKERKKEGHVLSRTTRQRQQYLLSTDFSEGRELTR